MKNKIRKSIRNIIGARENETIENALDRKLTKIQKIIYKRSFSKDELRTALHKVGVNEGTVLMVHCSWRKFYNFEGKPEDVIELLKELIGDSGTLLMPSYGSDLSYFDVNNTVSDAGVLSEVFRVMPSTLRGQTSHFAICGYGTKVHEILDDNINSRYGFDEKSAYYKFSQLPNAKVLFLGLGKEPTKISLFHCANYQLKNSNEYIGNIITHKYSAKLVIGNDILKKEMITRTKSTKNNKRVFKKILRSMSNRKYEKISNIEVVCIDAKEGIEKTIEFANKGIYCYK